MPKLAGVNHLRAVKAFQKAGFWIARKSKHITMTNGERIITIPRANPVDAYTMAGLVKDAGFAISLLAQILFIFPLRYIHDSCQTAVSLHLNAEFIPVLLCPKVKTGIALWLFRPTGRIILERTFPLICITIVTSPSRTFSASAFSHLFSYCLLYKNSGDDLPFVGMICLTDQ